MPPDHQARSEVLDHNIPDMNISDQVEIGSPLGAGGSGTQKMGNMPPEHQARSEVFDHNIPDMNISNEVEIGSPFGAGGSGTQWTQSGEGALDLTSR